MTPNDFEFHAFYEGEWYDDTWDDMWPTGRSFVPKTVAVSLLRLLRLKPR